MSNVTYCRGLLMKTVMLLSIVSSSASIFMPFACCMSNMFLQYYRQLAVLRRLGEKTLYRLGR